MIDLSHVSEAAMHDVLALSQAPVAFTHSSCHTLVPHVRNVPDSILDKLKLNGGVIMITFVYAFTSEGKADDINDIVDHILHVGKRIGFDHIGIGSDFDGTVRVTKGVEDVAKFPELVACMLSRGIEVGDVRKVLGWNVIRVLKDVEETAGKLKEQSVLEDEVLADDEVCWELKKKMPARDGGV